MVGIVLALLASISYALINIYIGMKWKKTNIISLSLVLTVIGTVILWPFGLLFSNPGSIKIEAILIFALAGIIGTGIARIIFY